MTIHSKDFDAWNPVKKETNQRDNIPTFSIREIWWCSTGVNVGVEQDGKNVQFERPVLIVRKFNKRLFWGIPLSTKLKDFPHFVTLEFKATKEHDPKERCFIVPQMRAMDSARLLRPLGKLTTSQFQRIIDEVKNLL
jgi:mRNA interferase MazF